MHLPPPGRSALDSPTLLHQLYVLVAEVLEAATHWPAGGIRQGAKAATLDLVEEVFQKLHVARLALPPS
ncbi:MAG: hypothetical protein HZB27_01750, partial [Meiothermus silvanus]|nr:hypothetical protein [Allomeiothermus silvanus]